VTTWISKISGITDYDGLDQGIVDGFGRVAQRFGYKLKGLQTGRLQNYILFAAVGMILIIILQTII